MKLTQLLAEGITLSGMVDVYHYTKQDIGDTATLSPNNVRGRSSYSRNDYAISSVPRVFYYTDLRKTERMVRSQHLYKGMVRGNRILDLTEITRNGGRQAKEILDAVKTTSGAIDLDALLKYARGKYDGVYYVTGGIPMVNLFISLKVERVSERDSHA